MPGAYGWALVYGLANSHQQWRGMYRLGRWAKQKMLAQIQRYSTNITLTGPIYVENLGTIEIGNYANLRSSWHKPIALAVTTVKGRLIIEDYVFVNWGVTIGVTDQVVIGSHSLIGDDVIIYDTDWHSLDGNDMEVPSIPTRIGRGVWIGARVIVLKGVTIGNNTVVAANSVVTSNLPNGVFAAGAPARVIHSIERKRYVEEI